MSIKPCPACKSEDLVMASPVFSDTHRMTCICGVSGPYRDTVAEAEAAWNALPRRGDGLAWRSEPPDRTGWWWQKIKTRDGWQTLPPVYCDSPNSVVVKGMAGLIEWAGPIPEPPATDAEKEAAK